MSRVIAVMGESGAGKTTSLRTLDPKTTFIIDADRKGLSWRGWKKQYNATNKNYLQSSNIEVIESYLKRIDGRDKKLQPAEIEPFKNIKTVVIDTLNTIMVDNEMKRMSEKGYDKWQDLASCIWRTVAGMHLLRSDLTVVCMCHSQTERDDSGYYWTRIKTSGKKLDKLVLESKFTTVLLAKVVDGKYVFETSSDHSTAKSPMDCFKDKDIPNDMKLVISTLKKYEEE